MQAYLLWARYGCTLLNVDYADYLRTRDAEANFNALAQTERNAWQSVADLLFAVPPSEDPSTPEV